MGGPFKDKICVIAGAGSGIGRALAQNLAGQGATLALSDINLSGLEETRLLLGDEGSNRIRIDQLDVADAAAIEAYAAAIKEAFGNADMVMNVAGLTRIGSFEETSLEAFEKVIDVNLWGVVRMSKAFLDQLIDTGGSLVNISSVFGMIGFKGQSHYCASKFAVRGFSETLAQELEDKGVSVVSVHPGGINTAIARNALVDALPEDISERAEFETQFEEAAKTSPERAAEIILNGAAKRKRRVLIGGDASFISIVQRLFPSGYGKIIQNFLGRGD